MSAENIKEMVKQQNTASPQGSTMWMYAKWNTKKGTRNMGVSEMRRNNAFLKQIMAIGRSTNFANMNVNVSLMMLMTMVVVLHFCGFGLFALLMFSFAIVRHANHFQLSLSLGASKNSRRRLK